MSDNNFGQMMWKREESGERALYLKPNGAFRWEPYKALPQYAVDELPHFSLGHTTFVHLLKKGWKAIPD
jgi:hypothetical protein